MQVKHGLVDLSSVIWTCLQGGRDDEFGLDYLAWGETVLWARDQRVPEMTAQHGAGKKYRVNSAQYGYDASVQHLLKAMSDLSLAPHELILVPEGRGAKILRTMICKDYKASGRDKIPQQYEEFNKCKQMLLDMFLGLGAQACWQDGGVEADDVLGYLAVHLDGQRYIISGDKDMAVLVNPAKGIHHWRAGAINKNPFGDFDHRLITTYIALVGDTADKIPGCPGFGDSGERSAWKKLWAAFGDRGLWAMDKLIREKKLHRLAEDVAELPLLQKIIDNEKSVYMSYALANIMLDQVNTARRPLSWRLGMHERRDAVKDKRLAVYGQQVRIVSQENFEQALPWLRRELGLSPYVTLDVETSTPDESDEWLAAMEKSEDRTPVDVLASELTSLQLTFGAYKQHTVYFPVDNVAEEGCTNLTLEQVAQVLRLVPPERVTYVHNAGFELTVLYQEVGPLLADNGWHGFLPNVEDTAVLSSFVDENKPSGLKQLSARLMGYQQTDYASVTTKTIPAGEWDGEGKLLARLPADEDEDLPERVRVQYKMRQLTAREVLNYGADDTICTAVLARHFNTVMAIEGTRNAYEITEKLAAYALAKGFVDGAPFSLQRMRAMQERDAARAVAARAKLDAYLVSIGYEGTTLPVLLPPAGVQAEMPDAEDEEEAEADDGPIQKELPWVAASLKFAFSVVAGQAIKTLVRTPSKLGKLFEIWADENADHEREDAVRSLGLAIQAVDVKAVNSLLARYFTGRPALDLASPQQMCRFLYDVLKLPVNLTNDLTPKQRSNQPLMAALKQHRLWRLGQVPGLSAEEWGWVRKKATANEAAILFALTYNADKLDDAAKEALAAVSEVKKTMTRNSLFYKIYWRVVHWRSGRVHPSIRQCGAATRRPTASMPNTFQLPKEGEGVEFRECYVPHKKRAIIVSVDFNAQELRLAAENSQDPNLLSCYVGDNKRDVHTLTGSGAMRLKWGAEAVKALANEYLGVDRMNDEESYKLLMALRATGNDNPWHKKANDLRRNAKPVNFGATYGAQALAISEQANMLPTEAQVFLDARAAMFPGLIAAPKRAEDACRSKGYAETQLGARRHLAEGIASDDRWLSSRAARQAFNFEIQGSANEMMKAALSSLWKRGWQFKHDLVFIASIYDEIVFSVTLDDAVAAIKDVMECMTQPYARMSVPIVASLSLGPTFGEQHELGEVFDPVLIQKKIDELFASSASV